MYEQATVLKLADRQRRRAIIMRGAARGSAAFARASDVLKFRENQLGGHLARLRAFGGMSPKFGMSLYQPCSLSSANVAAFLT